jgi:hypothetical protein
MHWNLHQPTRSRPEVLSSFDQNIDGPKTGTRAHVLALKRAALRLRNASRQRMSFPQRSPSFFYSTLTPAPLLVDQAKGTRGNLRNEQVWRNNNEQ